MSTELASAIWAGAGVYALIGFVVGLVMITVLLKRVSKGAATAAPLQFRLLILPGLIGLWPLVLIVLFTRPSARVEGGSS
ncbi:MAG: hypothetical protein AAFX09_01100 [Pseudomonadota bacterium]